MDKETKHPYLSWDEQIQHLETNKKLIIPDKKFAKLALQTFSYYSIVNGYKNLFLLFLAFPSGSFNEPQN